MRPYIVQILKSYGIPLSPNWATVSKLQMACALFILICNILFRHIVQVILGLTGIFGTITCVCVVKLTGKRRLYLFSLAGLCVAIIALGKQSHTIAPVMQF